MPTRYSHSPDTLCLSIRAFRLSGEEHPDNSGFFCLLRLPGEIMWAGAVYWGKLGLRGSDVWPLSLRSLQCSDTPQRTAIAAWIVVQNFRWLLLRKDGTWVFGSATQVTFLKWCFAACRERRGWVGFELALELYYGFSQNPNRSGLAVSSHTPLETFLIPPLTQCSTVFKAFPRASAYFSLATLWARQSTHYYQYHLQVIDFTA